MTTVTLSEDRRSAEETVAQVAGWISENMPSLLPRPPEVGMGGVIAQIGTGGRM